VLFPTTKGPLKVYQAIAGIYTAQGRNRKNNHPKIINLPYISGEKR